MNLLLLIVISVCLIGLALLTAALYSVQYFAGNGVDTDDDYHTCPGYDGGSSEKFLPNRPGAIHGRRALETKAEILKIKAGMSGWAKQEIPAERMSA